MLACGCGCPGPGAGGEGKGKGCASLFDGIQIWVAPNNYCVIIVESLEYHRCRAYSPAASSFYALRVELSR